ncbi:hypothetical protein OEG84_19695 [Hoeflea sp. G2-23]|uniref:Uncharacterized protein n=1 Tax=Hoeflea algicola TaxID=2983763 RepID=A0ABT3ZDI3_9HYPH|nr:hypothetical protein [Hoeflea algicola]MCY0149862.1 hypothetical protein [Hoeflea algicola]
MPATEKSGRAKLFNYTQGTYGIMTNLSSPKPKYKRKIEAHPISFVEKFKFLKSVILSKDFSALDHKVALIVCERYKDTFGNAETSLSYLEVGTGASRQGIVNSLARLKAYGALIVIEDYAGSRSTRYRPNLDYSGSQVDLTTTGQAELTSSGSQAELTSSGQAELTKSLPSSQAELTQYHLLYPPTGEVTVRGQKAPLLALAFRPRRARLLTG